MDGKIKRIIKKNEVAPQRKEQGNLSNRIRDAVKELKKYESPEIMREVHQICTPVSCYAYPIIKRYNKTKKMPVASYMMDPNPKKNLVNYGMTQTSSPFNAAQVNKPRNNKSQRDKKVQNLFQQKEISLATYLKTKAKEVGTGSKALGQGKYRVPDHSKPKKRMGKKTVKNAKTQVSDRKKTNARQVEKSIPIFGQNEAAVTYATVIPVHEMMMNKPPRQVLKKQKKKPKSKQNAASQSENANDTVNLHHKNLIRKYMIPDPQPNNSYATAPDSISTSESLVKKKARKHKKNQKRKVVNNRDVSKNREVRNNAIYRMDRYLGDIRWRREDIKAFRVLESREGSVRTEVATSPSRASHFDAKSTAAEESGRSECSYRMCRQCPLRQLISRIDPIVGQDKRSYPVVAFTCCRKAPVMKSTATST